jgi:lipoate-protein ligase A
VINNPTPPFKILPYDRDNDLMVAAIDTERPQVRLGVGPKAAVVIGRGGDPEKELFLANILRDQVPILRRPGGGGAVVLDPGNVIVSLALPLPGVGGIRSAFARISRWLISALAAAGVKGVRQQGVSDLALGNQKIGGSSIYRSRGLLYYTTTLLVEPDLGLVERYLRHPRREPDYRQGRTHREFLRTIAQLLPSVVAPGATKAGTLARRLEHELKRHDLASSQALTTPGTSDGQPSELGSSILGRGQNLL